MWKRIKNGFLTFIRWRWRVTEDVVLGESCNFDSLHFSSTNSSKSSKIVHNPFSRAHDDELRSLKKFEELVNKQKPIRFHSEWLIFPFSTRMSNDDNATLYDGFERTSFRPRDEGRRSASKSQRHYPSHALIDNAENFWVSHKAESVAMPGASRPRRARKTIFTHHETRKVFSFSRASQQMNEWILDVACQ